MTRSAAILLVAAAAVLAACAGPHPFVLSGDAKSVDVEYSGDVATAVPLAQHHCAAYEKTARLSYNGDGIASFDCVPR